MEQNIRVIDRTRPSALYCPETVKYRHCARAGANKQTRRAQTSIVSASALPLLAASLPAPLPPCPPAPRPTHQISRKQLLTKPKQTFIYLIISR